MEAAESHLTKFDSKGPPQLGKGVEYGGVKELMTCPYSESHSVGYGHFAQHLDKCRKMATADKLKDILICEFNATHHINKEVYEAHLTFCPDKRQHDHQAADAMMLSQMFGNPVIPPVPFTIKGKTPPSFKLVEKQKDRKARLGAQRLKEFDSAGAKTYEKIDGVDIGVMDTSDKIGHWFESKEKQNLDLFEVRAEDDDSEDDD